MKLKTDKNKKVFWLSLLLGLFLFFSVNIAFALEINYPRLPGAAAPQDFINTAPAEKIFSLFVQYVFNFFLWISGAVALGLFIYSGVLFLISAGNAEKLLEARSRITAAFFGLLLLFGSVIVFKTLNPDILTKTSIQTPPPVQTSALPESSLSPSGKFLSSLNAELPFGTIIEKNILETYAEPGKGKPRMERIKNIGENTVKLAMILKQNSEQLKTLVQQCSCDQAQPVCTDACTPAETSSPLGALSPLSLASYSDITGQLSETLGQDNLFDAFQLDDSIIGAIQNPADFVKVTDSLDSIAGITNFANLSQMFQAATDIANISIADPRNLTGLFGSLNNATKLWGTDLGGLMDIVQPVQEIINNPTDLGGILGSVNNLLSGVPGAPDLYNIKGLDIIRMGASVQNIAENSGNANDVLLSINDLMSQVPGNHRLTNINGINILAIGNSAQGIIDNRSNVPAALNSFNGLMAAIPGGPNLKEIKGVNLVNLMVPVQNIMNGADNSAAVLSYINQISLRAGGRDISAALRTANNIAEPLQVIRLSSGDLNSVLLSVNEILAITGGPNLNDISGINVLETMSSFEEIRAAAASGGIYNLMTAANNMAGEFGISFENINGVDVLGIMGSVKNIKDQAAYGSLTGLLSGINQLTDGFGVNLRDINGLDVIGIMSPVDGIISTAKMGDVNGLMSSLNQITGNLGINLTNIQGINLLETVQPFAALINNPLDLANAKDALSVLSQSFPELSGLQAALGDMQDIANIIKNPADFANIMNYSEAISAIAPQQFGQVLADLNQLNGLFPGAQNIMATFLGGSCTCDPCKTPRPQIQEVEQKNLGAIYSGAPITSGQQNASPQTSSLVQEQNNSTEEIRLLREELGKLENTEETMFECPLSGLSDLSEHLFTMEIFMDNKWFYSGFNFWKKIIIDNDWATFYCQVSGSTAEPATPAPGAGSFKENNNSAKRNPLISFIINTAFAQTVAPETSQEGPFACSTEIPVGEIIDRTQKTGAKIIERLETLIALDGQLIKAVDKLHSLVSQCTSQVPKCRSSCIPVFDEDGNLVDCIKECVGSPCPIDEIAQQVQVINEIIESDKNNSQAQEGIKDVVQSPQIKSNPNDPNNKEKIEKIGLTTVIEEVVPEILKDLGNKVREPMKKCSVEVSSQESANHLLNCQSSVGNIGPDGKLLENCCFNEDIFKKCLDECYLESGQTEKEGTLYKNCLADCLKIEGQKINSEDIPTCHHLINFYCCGI